MESRDGDVQVLGVAAHDSEAVYELSERGVGFAEGASERVVQIAFPAQSFDGFQGVGETEFGVFPALRYLPSLDVVFDVNDAARAELGVDRAALHQFAGLPASHVEDVGQVQRFAGIDE